jgi:hypothetical protein
MTRNRAAGTERKKRGGVREGALAKKNDNSSMGKARKKDG